MSRHPHPLRAPVLVSGAVLGAAAFLAGTLALAQPSVDRTTPLVGADRVTEGPSLDVQAQAFLGLGAGTTKSIGIDAAPGQSFTVTVPLDGADYTLQLFPFSVRNANYQLLAQLGDGSIVPMAPGESRTLRGTVDGSPDAIVAGSLMTDGLYATIIFPDGERYWIEAVGERLGLPDTSLHAIYNNADVLPTGHSCGMEVLQHEPDPEPAGGIAGGVEVLCVTELANDADVEYFNDYGSVQAVQDRIELVVNTTNAQYESEVGIRHVVTTTLVRTAEPDPYTSFNNTDLLCQFVNEWTNNQQAIDRDVAQLFTGREISGNVIGQAADLGSICEPDGCVSFPCNCGQFGTAGSYCFVQSDFNNNFSCATDLTAHELGHLWNAQHCSCPSNTMNPSITCANTFSNATRNTIEAYRDTRPCLDCLTGVTWTYPDGRPDLLAPAGGTTFRVEVGAGLETPMPGTGVLFVSLDGGGFSSVAMTAISPNVYDATFPSADCGAIASYYVQVNIQGGGTASDPSGAPGDTFGAVYGTGSIVTFEDDFETNMGWSVTNAGGLTDGAWNRGTPVGGGDRGDPPTDGDGSGQCYLTDNVDGNSDVDGGSTILTSPIMDASNGASLISYSRWYHNSFGGAPFSDIFVVEVSDNGGSTWSNLETVGPDGPEVSGGWFDRTIPISDAGIAATDQFRIRFTASDLGEGSVVEAGVDGVMLISVTCDEDCAGNLNGDDEVGAADLAILLAAWGPCGDCAEDFDDDGEVGASDLAILLAAWGPCP